LVVLAHLQRKSCWSFDLDQLEKKKIRKEQVWVVRGSENATKLVANAQPNLGGGTALSGVHRHPLERAQVSTTLFSYFGHNFSSELQFR
jgi:hypothetical protein